MTVDSQGLGVETEEKIGFRWVVLTHLGLANGTVVLFVLSLGVMLPSISKDLGLSPTMQGLLGSSALFGNLVLALPLSIVLSRYSGRIVLLGALVAMSVFGVGQAWAPVFAILLVSRWLFGQAAAAMHPARTLLINQWFPRREIIFANGLFNGTYGIAALMALGLLPFVLEWLDNNWRLVILISSLPIFVFTLAWAVQGRRQGAAASAALGGKESLNLGKTLGQHRVLWVVGLGMMGLNLTWSSLITFWPTLLLEEYGFSVKTSGQMFAMAAMLEGAGSVAVGYFVAKWAHRDFMGPSIAVLGTLVCVGSVGMAWTGSLPLLIIFALMHGVGFSLVPFVWTLPYRLPGFGARDIAVGIGFIETCLLAGGAIGPALTGFLQDTTGDLRLAMIITCSFSAAIAVSGVLVTANGFRRKS